MFSTNYMLSAHLVDCIWLRRIFLTASGLAVTVKSNSERHLLHRLRAAWLLYSVVPNNRFSCSVYRKIRYCSTITLLPIAVSHSHAHGEQAMTLCPSTVSGTELKSWSCMLACLGQTSAYCVQNWPSDTVRVYNISVAADERNALRPSVSVAQFNVSTTVRFWRHYVLELFVRACVRPESLWTRYFQSSVIFIRDRRTWVPLNCR